MNKGDDLEARPSKGFSKKTVVSCMAIFAVYNIALSVIHASLPSFDLISCAIGEAAALPLLGIIFEKVKFSGGGLSLQLQLFRALDRPYGEKAKEVLLPGKLVSALPGGSTTEPLIAANKNEVSPMRYDLQAFHAPEVSDVKRDDVFIQLRKQIELELRRISEAYGLPPERSTVRAIIALRSANIIAGDDAEGLLTLIQAGDAKMHGTPVSDSIAEFAKVRGPEILSSLHEISYVPQYLLSRVTQEAAIASIKVEIPEPGSGDSEYDLKVDSLLIEVKATAPTVLIVQMVADRLRRAIVREGATSGLMVFASRPSLASGVVVVQSIGMAWLDGDKFAGDEVAKRIAPWLFSRAAK